METAMDMKQFTEPIVVTLDRYRTALREHPLLVAARSGQIERTTLERFAYYQYSDSITWIPMLAQMKSKATRSRRLRRAIEDNIAHEAGLGGTSHVTLAAELMRSLGVRELAAFPTAALGRTAELWLSDAFAAMTEPALAGWLLTAETLVPDMFAIMRPCFAAICEPAYFDEHIAVDADEHAVWMTESIDDVIAQYGAGCVPTILEGMADAWAETCEDPDELWESRCASR
jgi:Iron-containing redox enzyme